MVVRIMGIIMSETTTSSKEEERRGGSLHVCGEREGTIRQRNIRREVRICGDGAKPTHLDVQHLPAHALEGVDPQGGLGGGVVDAVNEIHGGDDGEPLVEGGHTKGEDVDHVLRRAQGDPRRLHALKRVDDEPCVVHPKPAHFGRRRGAVRAAAQ
jgi:hypothetical protein